MRQQRTVAFRRFRKTTSALALDVSVFASMRAGILGCLAAVACGAAQTMLPRSDAGSAEGDAALEVERDAGDVASDAGFAEGDAALEVERDAGDVAAPEARDDATWIPTLHTCSQSSRGFMQYAPPPAGPSSTPCQGAMLSNPQVRAVEGGPVAPGTTATVSVDVTYAGSTIAYPCLAISSDTPGISFLASGGPEQYVLVPQVTFSVEVTFGASLAPGTRVRFAAWVAGGGGTTPDGSLIECTSGLLGWDVVLE
jgi:hypothetical protein